MEDIKISLFDVAFNFTVGMEGGYANDPDDPGGETKFGISKRAHPDLDIKNLTIEEAKRIYKKEYWDVMKCDIYPSKLAIVIFDASVNHGVNKTRELIDNLAICLINDRRNLYIAIANAKPVMKKYLKGWMNRMDKLENLFRIKYGTA